MTCHCGSPRCRGTLSGKDWRRQDLQAHTVYFDPKTINVHKVPTGSSILARTEAASQQPFLSAGPLRNLTPIREPNGSAYFAVFER